MGNHVKITGDQLEVLGKRYPLKEIGRVLVIGGGKASAGMALSLEGLLGERIEAGVVNIPRNLELSRRPRRIRLLEAGHPLPDAEGERGVEEMLGLLKDAGRGDLVICLLSGGGSALMPFPVEGIALEDKHLVTKMLLEAGASIWELNAVRKHLSAVKGGRLAAAHSAEMLVLVVSDVIGDPLDTIASGPCAPDATTFEDAVAVLQRFRLWSRVPEEVRSVLSRGLKRELAETPKEGDPVFSRVHTAIIGNNMTACRAAKEALVARGFNTLILTTRLQGEARQAGVFLASVAAEAHVSGNPVRRPCALVAGGETIVRVTGRGVGGRNQELILSATLKTIHMGRFAAASMGTDGADGSSSAAGAIIDSYTFERAKALGLSAEAFLDGNDSYSFFSGLGDTLITGPTGTNVNDITVFLLPP